MSSPRRTPQEWQSILDRFKTSGLTQAAFCEQEEIKVCTLRYWLYQPTKHEPQFVPVVMHEQTRSIGLDSQNPISLRVAGVPIEIATKDCIRLLRAMAH